MGSRVLVVEDDVLLRRSITKMLKKWSLHVDEATSAAEAVEKLKLKPSVLVVDYGLPDGTGSDVIRAASRISPRPKILVISGLAKAEEAFRLSQLGAHRYLAKPFLPDAFRSTFLEVFSTPAAKLLDETLLRPSQGR